MRKIIFVFYVLCTPIYAATMCVPDLSECESCTGGSYDYTGKWVADCCGVRVSGIAFYAAYRSGMVNTLDSSLVEARGAEPVVSVCVMTEPVMAPYFYLVSNYELNNRTCCLYNRGTPCVYNDGYATSAAANCAKGVKPTCMFSKCSKTLYCEEVCEAGGHSGGVLIDEKNLDVSFDVPKCFECC